MYVYKIDLTRPTHTSISPAQSCIGVGSRNHFSVSTMAFAGRAWCDLGAELADVMCAAAARLQKLALSKDEVLLLTSLIAVVPGNNDVASPSSQVITTSSRRVPR